MPKLRQLQFKNAPSVAMTRKQFDFDAQKLTFKAAGVGAGEFEGYGAVYGNIDRDNEIIAPGAFAASLPAFIRDGFIACAHDWDKGVATIKDAMEDSYGLLIKCEFHGDEESQSARTKAMERIERGKSVGLSVGFMPDEWIYDEKTGVRTITKATLYEVSIVTVPANPLAQVVSAKSAGSLPATVREFEKFLRDAGFSKSLAISIASKGFVCGMQDEPAQPADNPADADNEEADGVAHSEFLYLQFQAQQMGVKV